MKLRKMMSLVLATGLLAGSLVGCAASVASATPEQASNDVKEATVEAVALEEAIKMTTTDEIQPGATHVSLYDNVDQINEAVDRMDAFWTANVK
jgi:hydroxyethylthiazole kinase-like sugar kinase family protein